MKRSLIALTTAGLLTFTLTACTNDTDSANENPTTATSQGNSSETKDSGKKVEKDTQTTEEAQQAAADRVEAYTLALLEDHSDEFSNSAISGSEAPTPEDIIDFGDNEGKVLTEHFYFDDDFTTEEKSVVIISTAAANAMLGGVMPSNDEVELDFSIDPTKVQVDGDKAVITPDAVKVTVNGEAQDTSSANAFSSNSYLVRGDDGEWYIDARGTLDEVLKQTGMTADETLNALLSQN